MAKTMVQPSRSVLQKAWALGRKAGGDPRMRPVVADASDYSTFEKFRFAHRGRLEVKDVFARWDEQIMRIAEREGKRLGFRMDGASAQWDVLLAAVVVPLKNAFWIGWEGQIRLDQMYAAARKRAIVTGTLAGAKTKVFAATRLAVRVHRPEVEEPGDDAFLVSITESPERPSGTTKISGVNVLAASRLLERVEKPEVEELGDEVFLMSVTEQWPGTDAKKPGITVLEARKLVDRVQKPQEDEGGDDGFLLSVTEDGQVNEKENPGPGVLAASKLVALPTVPPVADFSDEDLWDANESPSFSAPGKPSPVDTEPTRKPFSIGDEDLPDLYEV